MNTGRMPVRSAFALVALGLAAAVILAGVDHLTGERIEHEQRTRALAAVAAMLPDELYDNALLDDTVEISLGDLPGAATVYRARREGEPTAAVIDLTTPRGYSGDIRLLVAVDVELNVLGVRILEHRETPGLGDRIEARRSDWIEQFSGRSLGDPEPEGWTSDQRGGEFDTPTSATITAAAVTEAIGQALQSAQAQHERMFQHTDND